MSAPDGHYGGGGANEGGASEDISMSVDATNALRAKLGLKPLAMTNAKDEAIKERSKELFDERESNIRELEMKAKIAKARNKRLLKKELTGGSTAERLKKKGAKSAGASVLDWVKHSRSVEKEEAAKRLAALDEQDEVAEYTEADLSGLKVNHDMESIRDGETVIMTLADTKILNSIHGDCEANDEGDQLTNIKLGENERREELIALRKRKTFDRYDTVGKAGEAEDELGATDSGTVLPHYDEVSGDKPIFKASFTLGEDGQKDDIKAKKLAAIKAKLAQGGAGPSAKATEHNVSGMNNVAVTQTSDYYTRDEMASFKKPKTKKRRKVRKKKKKGASFADELVPIEDDGLGTRDGADGERRKREQAHERAEEEKRSRYNNAIGRAEDASLHLVEDDDEELMATLARAQKLVCKKDSSTSWAKSEVKQAVEVAKEEDAGGDDGGVPMTDQDEDESIVFTETSEFCAAISTEHLQSRRVKKEVQQYDQGEDEQEEEASAWTTAEDIDVIKDGDEEDEGMVKAGNLNRHTKNVMAEPMVKSGLAAALQMARSKGHLLQEGQLRAAHGRTNDMKGQKLQVQMQAKKDAKDKAEKEKERKERKKKGSRRSRSRSRDRGPKLLPSDVERRDRRDRDERKGRERERDRQRDREDRDGHGDKQKESMKNKDGIYKPTPGEMLKPQARQGNLNDANAIDDWMRKKVQEQAVTIDYTDQWGRELSCKEAFRELSHAFHGKQSGKGKTEKMMRKLEEEKKQRMMSAIDTPLNSMAALKYQQNKTKSAHINLDAKRVLESEIRPKKRKKKKKITSED